jgi:hypothetical protein
VSASAQQSTAAAVGGSRRSLVCKATICYGEMAFVVRRGGSLSWPLQLCTITAAPVGAQLVRVLVVPVRALGRCAGGLGNELPQEHVVPAIGATKFVSLLPDRADTQRPGPRRPALRGCLCRPETRFLCKAPRTC